MAKASSKIEHIEDDDEKGGAQPAKVEVGVDPDAAERNAKNLVETTGADKGFVSSSALQRAVSLLEINEKATQKLGKVNGLPKGAEVLEAVVRGVGDKQYLVVLTTQYRKLIRAL